MILQYNYCMYKAVACLIIIAIGSVSPSLSFAIEEESPQQPSAKDRLQQVLNEEGGTTVYMDAAGNVHNTTTLPNGDQIIRVQPPQIPGLNLGPPLQLNNRTLQLPPPPPVPVKPPPPEFPQRAR